MRKRIKYIVSIMMLVVTMITNMNVAQASTVKASPLELWSTATDKEFWKQTFYMVTSVLGYSVTADIYGMENAIDNFEEYMSNRQLVRDGLMKVNEDGTVTIPDELMDATRQFLFENVHSNSGIVHIVQNPSQENILSLFQNSSVVSTGKLGALGYKNFTDMMEQNGLFTMAFTQSDASIYNMLVVNPAEIMGAGAGIYISDIVTVEQWNSMITTSTIKTKPKIKFGKYNKETGAVDSYSANIWMLSKWSKTLNNITDYDTPMLYATNPYIYYYTSSNNTYQRYYYNFVGKPVPLYLSESWYIYYATGKGGEFASNKFINYDYDIDNSVTYNFNKINDRDWQNYYTTIVNNNTGNVQNIVNNGGTLTVNDYIGVADETLTGLLEDLLGTAEDIEDDIETSNSWLKKIYKKLDEILSAIKNLTIVGTGEEKKGILDWLLGLIGGAITGLFDIILGIFRAIGDAIMAVFTNVISFFTEGIVDMITALFNSLKFSDQEAEVGEVGSYFEMVNGVYNILPAPITAGFIISMIAIVVVCIIKYLL